MKILLDECLPRQLKSTITGHPVATVPEMGWQGLKNGALLRKAEKEFDVFVTIDQGIRYQQNLANAQLGIILLLAPNNRFESLRPLAPQILSAVETIQRGDVIRIGSV